MILSTTGTIEGREVERDLGIVFGDAVLGMACDRAPQGLPAQAQSLGTDAVIGTDTDREALGSDDGMLVASASGTAVTLERGGDGAPPSLSTRPGG